MKAVAYPPAKDSPQLRLSRMEALTEVMRKYPKPVTLVFAAALSALMGWLDYTTTWEVSLFVFYGLPVVITAWWTDSRSAMSMAVFSGLIWWIANNNTSPYETQLGYAWATISRAIFIGDVAFAVTTVRNRQEADAERIRVFEERRQLEEDLVAVSEHEQQRIGQDLHDGLCQHLAAIGLAARALADDLREQELASADDAEMIEESIRQAVSEARGLARGIFPVHVDRHGLAVSLAELAQSTSRLTGVKIHVEETGDTQISPPEAAMHLYRIVQEAVANAVRHGGAQQVDIHLEGKPDTISVIVEDDGTGIPKETKSHGMGLRTMRYRAQVMGASLDISEKPGGGTRVTCRVPVERGAS